MPQCIRLVIKAGDHWGSVILGVVLIKWCDPCLDFVSPIKEDFLSILSNTFLPSEPRIFSFNSNGNHSEISFSIARWCDEVSQLPECFKYEQILITSFSSYSFRSTLYTLLSDTSCSSLKLNFIGSRPSGFWYLHHMFWFFCGGKMWNISTCLWHKNPFTMSIKCYLSLTLFT